MKNCVFTALMLGCVGGEVAETENFRHENSFTTNGVERIPIGVDYPGLGYAHISLTWRCPREWEGYRVNVIATRFIASGQPEYQDNSTRCEHGASRIDFSFRAGARVIICLGISGRSENVCLFSYPDTWLDTWFGTIEEGQNTIEMEIDR